MTDIPRTYPASHTQRRASADFFKGVRTSIKWLHDEAEMMVDPHAKSILNNAAYSLGVAKPSPAVETGGADHIGDANELIGSIPLPEGWLENKSADPLIQGMCDNLKNLAKMLEDYGSPEGAKDIYDAREVLAVQASAIDRFEEIAQQLAARALTAESDLARAREALGPFATVARLIDLGWYGRPGDQVPDRETFQSGCAWTKDGETRTLTIGDFRSAEKALTAIGGGS